MAVVMVRNTSKKPLVIPLGRGEAPLVFQPSGDAAGGDIIPIDAEVAESAAIHKALSRGYIVKDNGEDDEEFHADLARREEERLARRAEAQAAKERVVTESIDRKQDRDLVGLTCVAPSEANPNLPCGVSVIRPAVVKGDAPPLCGVHENQSANYVAVEVEDPDQAANANKMKWVRTGVDRPSRPL